MPLFTAEIWVIPDALKYIKTSDASKYIILHSFSCLQSLNFIKLNHPLIGMVIRKSVLLSFKENCVLLGSQSVSIRDNDTADLAAKVVFNLPLVNMGILYFVRFKFVIDRYILSNWQREWSDVGANTLNSIKPVLEDWQSCYR